MGTTHSLLLGAPGKAPTAVWKGVGCVLDINFFYLELPHIPRCTRCLTLRTQGHPAALTGLPGRRFCRRSEHGIARSGTAWKC